MENIRIGVDWGGTKIEVAVLAESSKIIWRKRQPTPNAGYAASIKLLRNLVTEAERDVGTASIGIGIPGTISPHTGLVMNANSVWLNGKPLEQDLTTVLKRPVRIANDANCFAVSEAIDGAGSGAAVVFGVIIGTGVGGGIALNGHAHGGKSGIAGEWGHTPLPWHPDDELPDNTCWCGRTGCLETYLSGPGLALDYTKITNGTSLSALSIFDRMRDGEPAAVTCFNHYCERFSRSIAKIINILDPDVIVLGGGLSNVDELYEVLPRLTAKYAFTDHFDTPIRKALHGDSSGVRGAAWLWK